MSNEYTPDLDTVLFEYLSSQPEPSYDKLNEWSKKYPQYAKELADIEVGRAMMDMTNRSRILSSSRKDSNSYDR